MNYRDIDYAEETRKIRPKYTAIAVNDCGGLTRGVQLASQTTVKLSILPNDSERKVYHGLFPEIPCKNEINVEDFKEAYDFLILHFQTMSHAMKQLRQILDEDNARPKLLFLATRHNYLTAYTEKEWYVYVKFARELEQNYGYRISGMKWRQTQPYLTKDTIVSKVHLHGLPLHQEEYYYVCWDLDRYAQHVDLIQDMNVRTTWWKKGRSHDEYLNTLQDIIDPDCMDIQLFTPQKEIWRLKRIKGQAITIINDLDVLPSLIVHDEDDRVAFLVQANPEVKYLLDVPINKERLRYLSEDEFAGFKGFKGYAWMTKDKDGKKEDHFKWNSETTHRERCMSIVNSMTIPTAQHMFRDFIVKLELLDL